MISSLTGTVNFKTLQGVEVQVGQIGYWVVVSTRLIADLEIGEKTTFYTDLIVGEKLLELYGFSSRQEIKIFRMLTSVSGVGPRTALQIFNAHDGQVIEEAIDKADVAFFQSIKGIGKKTAQRLIVDLRSTLDQVRFQEEKEFENKEPTVYQALVQLGFSKEEIRLVIDKIDEAADDEEKIAQALKLLSGND
ncbi:MAG: Holliday junction branch migration protein RuvA [Candidatus Shapirobacteria bacterium]|nr:Holliday junction branch migration protein RuvA [Candidatus Shapirobacteria bacterium]